MEIVTGESECPSCMGMVKLEDVMQNEVTKCPECEADLEVIAIAPLTLDFAPEEEEDWGE